MIELWQQFIGLANELDVIRVNLLNKGSIADFIQQALDNPAQRGAAFELMSHLATEDRQKFLPILVDLACYYNKYQNDAFLVICSLPRQWVAEHISAPVEQILQRAHEEEFGLLLNLLSEVNPNYGIEIARRGLDNNDQSIRQIAKTFLSVIRP